MLAGMMLQWGRNLTVAEGSVGTIVAIAEGKLQWGRNLTVAEGALPSPAVPEALPLQWGRNLTVAEGSTSAGTCSATEGRFNGAAT